jgi:hypothetical protein
MPAASQTLPIPAPSVAIKIAIRVIDERPARLNGAGIPSQAGLQWPFLGVHLSAAICAITPQ